MGNLKDEESALQLLSIVELIRFGLTARTTL